MTRTVRILRRAQADLEEIRHYIQRDAREAAVRFLVRLLDRIEALATLPQIGFVPSDDRLRALGYRVLAEGQYLIFYKVLRRQIRVYRILHGKRRYWDIL